MRCSTFRDGKRAGFLQDSFSLLQSEWNSFALFDLQQLEDSLGDLGKCSLVILIRKGLNTAHCLVIMFSKKNWKNKWNTIYTWDLYRDLTRFERCISTMPLVTEKFTFVDNYKRYLFKFNLCTLLNATLAKYVVIAFMSKYSKGRCLVLVKGIAKLKTLIILSPSEEECNRALYYSLLVCIQYLLKYKHEMYLYELI